MARGRRQHPGDRSVISCLCREERIDLCCNDKVISVQRANLMRPEGYRHLTPFRENSRMMAFGLGKRTDPICKRESIGEILKPKNAFQPRNRLALYDSPIRDLGLQLLDLRVTYARRITSTCGAFFVGKRAHIFLP